VFGVWCLVFGVHLRSPISMPAPLGTMTHPPGYADSQETTTHGMTAQSRIRPGDGEVEAWTEARSSQVFSRSGEALWRGVGTGQNRDFRADRTGIRAADPEADAWTCRAFCARDPHGPGIPDEPITNTKS
jgi:hypothetical protein